MGWLWISGNMQMMHQIQKKLNAKLLDLCYQGIIKKLKEMYTQILYKSDGKYYIEEIIPGEYSERGEFITHYQVSEETAKYILAYLE